MPRAILAVAVLLAACAPRGQFVSLKENSGQEIARVYDSGAVAYLKPRDETFRRLFSAWVTEHERAEKCAADGKKAPSPVILIGADHKVLFDAPRQP